MAGTKFIIVGTNQEVNFLVGNVLLQKTLFKGSSKSLNTTKSQTFRDNTVVIVDDLEVLHSMCMIADDPKLLFVVDSQDQDGSTALYEKIKDLYISRDGTLVLIGDCVTRKLNADIESLRETSDKVAILEADETEPEQREKLLNVMGVASSSQRPQASGMESGASVPTRQPLSIIILGKTGHGKSATGNTLLQDHTKFRSEMSSQSVTQVCSMQYGEKGGRPLYVVDTPGTMDTDKKREAFRELKKALDFRPQGFHAFLIVLRLGTRMTIDERNAIDLLSKVFGQRLMEFSILVFTYGDTFHAQVRRTGKAIDFKSYIMERESGYLKSLISKCGNRCVLINNLSENEAHEAGKVIEMIDNMLKSNYGQPFIPRFVGGEECFPGNSAVITKNWTTTLLKDVRVGQEVLTITGCHLEWSPIYMFGHATQDIKSTFLCIETGSRSLMVTPNHHLFTLHDGKKLTKSAKDVILGETVLILDSKHAKYKEEKVIKIGYVEEKGLYAPFTMTGTIIVDGFLVSCYINMVPPPIAHPLLWPVRQMYRMFPATLASINKNGDNGIPQWIRWCMDKVL